MGIEFNGDLNFNRLDLNNNVKSQKATLANLNPAEIGNLLRNTGTEPVEIDGDLTEMLIKSGIIKKREATPEQKEALAKLNEKVSSTGISYGDANKKIDEIREKYKDDKYFTEVTVEREQPKNLDIYYPPVKKKVFDESKLPEPARTEYREAMEAKKEIENNNTALAKKAGITPAGKDKAPVAGRDISDMLKKLGLKPGGAELTEKQKAAREKLDEKQASTGVKYKDAKATLSQLQEKYKDSCRSKFESDQPKDIQIYIMPYEAFDPYKIPEPDKTAYFDALAAINEIEESNSALLAQGGLSRTGQPSRNYAGQHSIMYQNFKDEV